MKKQKLDLILAVILVLLIGCSTGESESPVSPTPTPQAPASTATTQVIPETPVPTGTLPINTLEPEPTLDSSESAGPGMIVFYSGRDGNSEIYTMNADGSDQRPLTFNQFEDSSPVWTPDGSQITFISDREDPNPVECFPECFYQIYIMNGDGSDEQKLIETELSTLHPDWHPDGTKLSFDTEFNLQGDIYSANADGGDLALLIKDGFWADWSPDGTQIAFASNRDGNVEIYLADADGGNQRRLTNNQRMDLFPAWSPDGESIAFMAGLGRGGQLFVMNIDGSGEQQLTTQGNVNEDPAWSPDGSHIVFQSSRDENFEIYTLNVEQALQNGDPDLQRLTDTSEGDFWPSWGPAATSQDTEAPAEVAGNLIAFVSTRDGNGEIYVMNADGSELRRLTDWRQWDGYPTWSPDGEQIAYYSYLEQHDWVIKTMNSDGSNPDQLTDNHTCDGAPRWSPDGHRIAYSSDPDCSAQRREIIIIEADGDNPINLTGNEADDMGISWSPDGQQIVFASDRDGDYEIYIMAADGSNIRQLTLDETEETMPAWSPDGSQIAFVSDREGNEEIYLMDLNGDHLNRLTENPAADWFPEWSPDGTRLLFSSQRDGNLEVYVMDADGSNVERLTNHPADDFNAVWQPAPAAQSTIPVASISFEKSAQTFASVPTWKISLADLDGDGDLDAVFSNAGADPSQVWLNDGNGFYSDTGQELRSYGHGVDVGDVDGDGDLDVVITTHRDAEVSNLYLNDGNAVFQALETAFDENVGFSVDLIDIDGDGDLDAVGEDPNATKVLLNNGAGIFALSETSFPLTTVWGDLDSDGDVDVLIKEEGVGYSVRLNEGGTQGATPDEFNQHWSLADPAVMGIGDMALGDIDDDGDLNVIITNGHHRSTSHPTRVFVNDGTGRFADSGQRLSAVRNAGIGLGDLDGDGDLDLVLADYMEACQIWLNDGVGRFSDSGFRFGEDQFYRHVHLVDLDGDGDLDIFLATFGINQGPNEIWFNQDR